jgi:hypothetical protein
MADGSPPAWVAAVGRPLLRTLLREFLLLTPLDLRPLVAWARTLARITPENFAHFEPFLGSPDLQHPHPLLAYVYPDANALPVAVTVISLESPGSGSGRDTAIGTEPGLPVSVPPTHFLREPRSVRLRVPAPGVGAGGTVEGTARVEGQDGVTRFRARPSVAARSRSPVPSLTLEETLSRHPFRAWDEATRQLCVEPGRWSVDGSLVLPRGGGLLLPAGTTLRFGRGTPGIATSRTIASAGPMRK